MFFFFKEKKNKTCKYSTATVKPKRETFLCNFVGSPLCTKFSDQNEGSLSKLIQTTFSFVSDLPRTIPFPADKTDDKSKVKTTNLY